MRLMRRRLSAAMPRCSPWRGGIVALAALLILTSGLPREARANVGLSKLRVIYEAAHPDATITASNNGTKPAIVQTWIESADGKLDTPFFSTPPLFRLDPGETNLIRVTLVGHAPDTQVERRYWLNVKEIPPEPDSGGNTLQFAIRTRLKLLYRPAGLNASFDPAHDLKLLPNGTSIENTSPYVASLIFTCRDNNQQASLTLDPRSTQPLPKLPCSPSDIRIQSINDYGGISSKFGVSSSGTKPASE